MKCTLQHHPAIGYWITGGEYKPVSEYEVGSVVSQGGSWSPFIRTNLEVIGQPSRLDCIVLASLVNPAEPIALMRDNSVSPVVLVQGQENLLALVKIFAPGWFAATYKHTNRSPSEQVDDFLKERIGRTLDYPILFKKGVYSCA